VEGSTSGNEATLEEEDLERERSECWEYTLHGGRRGQGGPQERQKRHRRRGKKTSRRDQLLFFMMRIDFPPPSTTRPKSFTLDSRILCFLIIATQRAP
jgi:hypothetical protein